MADAIPALERAKKAVDCLEKKHIGEMKALANPPVLVILTAKVVMTLLGEKINPTEPDEKVWKKAG